LVFASETTSAEYPQMPLWEMSMPSFVSASVRTMLASASITAGCSKKESGW